MLIGCFYATHRLWNLLRLVGHTGCGKSRADRAGLLKTGREPNVTIQICCYNEVDVIAATINAAYDTLVLCFCVHAISRLCLLRCSVDWPKDRLVVDVLDDSSDETSKVVEKTCAKWRKRGVAANRRTRPDRLGYKAGNLQYHHTHTLTTEFVAIFDADHRAHPDFLRRAMPHFFDDRGEPAYHIALVQCPWGYYNQHANLLTECDALNLDAAFVVEQYVRSKILGVLSFNGTGGVWRKTAIDAGGGWQWDTITEDLDLSYRAYIAGYKFRFLPDVVQLLEIPATMSAFKSQKHRWAKGFSQVTTKSLIYFLQTPLLSPCVKFEAAMHLTTNIQYVVALWLIVWMPVLAYKELVVPQILTICLYPAGVWFLVATAGAVWKIQLDPSENSLSSRLWRLFYILPSCAIALGMSVAETCAFLEGLVRRYPNEYADSNLFMQVSVDATFVRTPKEGSDNYVSRPCSPQGPTEAQKLIFATKRTCHQSCGERVSGSVAETICSMSTSSASISSFIGDNIITQVNLIAYLLGSKSIVLLLEILVTIYLSLAVPFLVSRSMHDERGYEKYAHVPATLLSLSGFLYVTLSTFRAHFSNFSWKASFAASYSAFLRSLDCFFPCRHLRKATYKKDQDSEAATFGASSAMPLLLRSKSSNSVDDDEENSGLADGIFDDNALTRRVFCHTSIFGTRMLGRNDADVQDETADPISDISNVRMYH